MRTPTLAAVVLAAVFAGCAGEARESSPDAGRAERRATPRTCAATPGGSDRMTLAPAGTPSRIRLGPGMELTRTRRTLAGARRGAQLLLSGTVRTAGCAPLAGATVQAWQPNGAGLYGPGEDDRVRCCYVQGTARTDARGRYAMRTVVPRGYGRGPPHIHLQAGHPSAAALVTEVLFGEQAAHEGTTVRLEPVGGGEGHAFRAGFDIVLRDR